MARGERHLLLHQLVDLVFDHLLVEKLTRGDAVDLRAKRGDAVFIIMLHAGLARHGGADQVVAQHEIGRGKEITDRQRRRRSRRRALPSTA